MAAQDGKRSAPPSQDKRAPAAAPPDRPEAFGRGEHPQPPEKKDDKGQGDGKGEQKVDDGRQKDGQQKDGGGDKGQEKKADPKPFYKRPVLMTVLVGVLLLAGLGGAYLLVHSLHYQSTDDAFIDGRIVRVAPRVAGKVLRLNVDDNVQVAADSVLIEVDPQPFQVKLDQATAAAAQADAQEKQAEAQLSVQQAMAAQAYADVQVAQANARNAQQNLDRFTRVSEQARSRQQLDQATADQKATAATVEAQVKRAQSMDAQVRAAQTTVNAQLANVKAAASGVESAQLDLSYCRVRAGHAGRVTRRQVEVGNYVTVGQEVLDVVPTEVPDVWVTANFKESQLTHMERGQRVSVKVDAYPDQVLSGHVDSIQNGTGAVFSLLPAENATGNYVKVVQRIPVKIVIDDSPRHMLSPGLSVEPEVDISSRPSPGVEDDVASRPPPATRADTPTPTP